MRGAANTVYESHEYDQLVRRGFRPYSDGHQRMYLSAIERIKNDIADPRSERPNGARIFEAGFGIGFGLTKMQGAGIIERYFGVEPNLASFNYTKGLSVPGDITLTNEAFSQAVADRITVGAHARFDEAFCIEVIEHVPMDLHLQFLIALRQMAPRLWFSSPCKTKSREGVRNVKEWQTLLRQAKFTTVKVNRDNWTYLYECK